MSKPMTLEERIQEYQDTRRLKVVRSLGVGTQGTVLMIDDLSRSATIAVKFHEREIAYNREVGVYERLAELGIDSVLECRVPLLVGYDDDLLAIEMTIVSPPFCLDFGGAYLDAPPDYSPEVWDDWRAQKSEAFEHNWPKVEEILAEFRSLSIYIADVNPGNIRF